MISLKSPPHPGYATSNDTPIRGRIDQVLTHRVETGTNRETQTGQMEPGIEWEVKKEHHH